MHRKKRGVKGKRVMKHRGRRGAVKVLSNLNPIPARQIVKMKYADVFTTSVANAYNYNYNLNSIFDPNRTGVGHQPYGHDQLSTLYNRYRVIACSYVVQAYSGSYPIRFGTLPANEVKTVGTIAELIENPRAQYKLQIPGGSTQLLRGKVYIPALMGRTKTQYMSDDRYQAQFGTSPQELAILNMSALTMTEVGTDVNFQITLEYTVEVFDPNPLGQS